MPWPAETGAVYVFSALVGRDAAALGILMHVANRTDPDKIELCLLEQLHLVEIDVEEDPEIAEAGGITGTPTVQLFKKKERIHSLPGVKMKREYRQLIQEAL